MNTSEITAAFLKGLGKWNRCCWPTQFGPSGLNLKGLKSSQARLMAQSTAGQERDDWRAATHWLEQLERDAGEAEREAKLATDLAQLGEFKRALQRIQAACTLESKYDSVSVWEPLRNAIAEKVEDAEGALRGAERRENTSLTDSAAAFRVSASISTPTNPRLPT
jgi:hypothetical protein